MSPYIEEERRDIIEVRECKNAGELNYFLTTSILFYLSNLNYNKLVKSKKVSAVNNYADYNEVIGVLECVKQELYRKVISKYEDKKEKENGTVWE